MPVLRQATTSAADALARVHPAQLRRATSSDADTVEAPMTELLHESSGDGGQPLDVRERHASCNAHVISRRPPPVVTSTSAPSDVQQASFSTEEVHAHVRDVYLPAPLKTQRRTGQL